MNAAPLPETSAHFLDGRARRRIAVAGFSAFVTVAITVPLVFSSSAGATTSPHHYPTPVTVCTTTTTLGATTTTNAATTTTAADTTTTAPDTTTTLPATTTSAAEVPGITTPITEQSIGRPGIVQLGVTPGPNFVTLPVSEQAAAATQLPHTGSSSLPVALGGLALLLSGALALTTKRRRELGTVPVNPKERS